MNKEQLERLVVIPTLKKIKRGYSKEATLAIMMIIAHESNHGQYIKQLGKGPALGFIQMEPRTHKSVWMFGDSIWRNAVATGIISYDDFNNKVRPEADRLVYDLQYNVFMARQRLFMKPKALPTDKLAMSRYLKQYWNSTLGAAKPMDYVNAYELWV